jgi:hypothetical protein
MRKPTVSQRYYTLAVLILVVLGTWLLVASYTPAGAHIERSTVSDALRIVSYGAAISAPLVLLAACCYMAAYYFYKNTADLNKSSGH